ncbi:hypothetical protein AAD001_17040 [Colwelliaceae bacterium 6471]
MALTRDKAKGRRTSGAFVPFPCSVMNHQNFTNLTPLALKLFIDVCSYLRFKQGGTVNNGDLAITWELLKLRGWTSKASIDRAKNELLYYGFIVITRHGMRLRHMPTLYALTFFGIDECNGKVQEQKPCVAPLNTWQKVKDKYQIPKKKPANKKFTPQLVNA